MEANSTEQVTKQHSPQSSKSLWLVFVILLLIVGVGSYILGTKTASTTQNNQQVSQAVPTTTQPSPTQAMTKDDQRRLLIDRCGDIPREKLNLPIGHYTVVDGPSWSPDCRHIAWSVWNSGTVAINPDGTGTGVKGNAEEGIFLYNDTTGRVTKLSIATPYNNNPVFQEWKDRNTLLLDYNTNSNKGRANFIYDITTNTTQPQ